MDKGQNLPPSQDVPAAISLDRAETPSGPATPVAAPPEALAPQASPDVLNRLWAIIESRRNANPKASHSARLLARGTSKVAQKLGEEATECLLELMAGNRAGVISESADLLYHLLVAWVDVGVRPEQVWQALQRRERASRLTEAANVPLKRLRHRVQLNTTKIP